MIRGLIPCFILLAAVPVASAQGVFQPEPAPKPKPPDPIRLTVQPAAVPTSALKYKLLPELRDRTPGNAAVLYYRAFSPEWNTHRKPEIAKVIDKWTENTRQVPPDELGWVRNSKMLEELDRAARRDYCEWEMTPRLREDGIMLLLPDMQAFRGYASLLSLRARFEIADKDYDKAVRTLQTGLSLGRDVSHAPTLIQALVGIAICQIMLIQAEELIQAPGSPNLYWALTDLPRPFVGLRKSLEGERVMIDSLFPGVRELLAEPKAKPMPKEQLQAMVGKLGPLAQDPSVKDFVAQLTPGEEAHKANTEAKKYLIAQGRNAKDVEGLPMQQAILMHQVSEYDRFYDELMKWRNLPYWEGAAGLRETEKQLKAAKEKANGVGATLALLLVPAVAKVMEADTRLDRRIAALRCVETIRLYAAAHDGKPPAALADIKQVPLPVDPFTGKAFEYKVDGNKVTLTAPTPPGQQPNPGNTTIYELTFKR